MKRTESIRDETFQQAISSTNLINDRSMPSPLLEIQDHFALQSIQKLSKHYSMFDNEAASSHMRMHPAWCLFSLATMGIASILTSSSDGKPSPEMKSMRSPLTSYCQKSKTMIAIVVYCNFITILSL
jgi:hypothetical protein